MTPRTLRPYEKAEKIRMEKENKLMHIQGAYFFDALCIALSNAFSKGSGKEYPSQPYRIFPLTKEEQEEENRKELELLIQNLTGLKNNWDSTHSQ